ncbi:MAG TPA: hypothetical protein VMW43_10845 [Bacteroidota bacterium]|nr:hypothetical protein [Bacteroidota bacterium]
MASFFAQITIGEVFLWAVVIAIIVAFAFVVLSILSRIFNRDIGQGVQRYQRY